MVSGCKGRKDGGQSLQRREALGTLRGFSEGCWAGGGPLETAWLECNWRDSQWDLDLGILCGGSVRILGGNPCPESQGCSASPHCLLERGIKLGSHRGERKGKESVKPLDYTVGAPEGTATGSHCPSCLAGLADGPLEAGGTLLGTGRGGDLDCGGRTVPHRGAIRFEGQLEDVTAGASLCSV